MMNDIQIRHLYFLTSSHIRFDLEQAHDLLPPAVTDIDALSQLRVIHKHVIEFLADECDCLQYVFTDLDFIDAFLPLVILFLRNRITHVTCNVRVIKKHLVEVIFVADALAYDADEESIPQSLQSFTLGWQLVAGSYKEFQWKVHLTASVAEDLLVQHGEKRVLDGWACLPYLIQQDNVSIRKIPFGDSLLLLTVLELGDTYRAEHLIRCRESRHQVLE